MSTTLHPEESSPAITECFMRGVDVLGSPPTATHPLTSDPYAAANFDANSGVNSLFAILLTPKVPNNFS